jgi:hypothetical protein
MIRTDYLQEYRFKADLNTPEIEFFLRLSEIGCRFYFTPKYLTEYRVHNQSATSSGLKVHLLMKYLIPLKVSPANKNHKVNFLKSLSTVAVNNLLKENSKAEALKILFSKYYKIRNLLSLRGMLQVFMIILPVSFNKKVLVWNKRLKKSSQ